MEAVIFLIWCLLLLAIPLAFFVTAFVTYSGGAKVFEIVLSFSVALICYVCVTALSIPLMFMMVFAGAHTEPVGQALDWKGKFLYSGLIIAHGIIGWLLCSLIHGKLIKPQVIFYRDSNKNQSISNANQALLNRLKNFQFALLSSKMLISNYKDLCSRISLNRAASLSRVSAA